MRTVEHKFIRVVFEKDANDFEKSYNQTMEDLAAHDIEVAINTDREDGFCAIVKYSIEENLPEGIEDELQIRGIKITCADCPYLQETTDRRRKKKRNCEHAKFGYTFLDAPACNKFYNDLIRWFFDYQNEKKIKGATAEPAELPEHIL